MTYLVLSDELSLLFQLSSTSFFSLFGIRFFLIRQQFVVCLKTKPTVIPPIITTKSFCAFSNLQQLIVVSTCMLHLTKCLIHSIRQACQTGGPIPCSMFEIHKSLYIFKLRPEDSFLVIETQYVARTVF